MDADWKPIRLVGAEMHRPVLAEFGYHPEDWLAVLTLRKGTGPTWRQTFSVQRVERAFRALCKRRALPKGAPHVR